MLRSAPLLSLFVLSFCLVACGSGSSGSGGGGTTPPSGTPQLSITPTALMFPSTVIGNTSASQTVTLTNSGGGSLSFSSITLADTANYSLTNNCASSLAAGSSCTLSVAFRPQSAAALASSITVTDSAPGSPQTVTLTGTGTAAASGVTRTLYTFPESDNLVTPLYALVQSANKTIDMTMYALQDTTFTNYLIAACKRGVTVRVVLDGRLEKTANAAAITALNAQQNCTAVYANTYFNAVHQKTLTVDGTTSAIMSLNLQSKYYSTTRDFALVSNDASDIAAIEATFEQDYAVGNGGSNVNEFNYIPTAGDDLIWSPTTAKDAMTKIIANAQKTLVLENEELASSASYIVSALSAACQRGVVVHFAIVYQSDWKAQLDTIKAAGCSVHTYPDTTTGFYIHAKAVVADYGLPTQQVYMGSINYSNASMTQNRELGLYITDPAIVNTLNTTMSSDYAGGTAY